MKTSDEADTEVSATYMRNVLKECINADGVDFCFSESQLKSINEYRRGREGTDSLTADTEGDKQIVEVIKAIDADKKDDLTEFTDAMNSKRESLTNYNDKLCNQLVFDASDDDAAVRITNRDDTAKTIDGYSADYSLETKFGLAEASVTDDEVNADKLDT
jgi:hypothetical protein